MSVCRPVYLAVTGLRECGGLRVRVLLKIHTALAKRHGSLCSGTLVTWKGIKKLNSHKVTFTLPRWAYFSELLATGDERVGSKLHYMAIMEGSVLTFDRVFWCRLLLYVDEIYQWAFATQLQMLHCHWYDKCARLDTGFEGQIGFPAWWILCTLFFWVVRSCSVYMRNKLTVVTNLDTFCTNVTIQLWCFSLGSLLQDRRRLISVSFALHIQKFLSELIC